MKRTKPKFYALVNNFNNGKLEKYDVVPMLLDMVLNSKGKIDKKRFIWYNPDTREYVPVNNPLVFHEYFMQKARIYFSGDCNFEFIKVDWPYSQTGMIGDSRPVKVDVWMQLEPNMEILIQMLWEYLEPRITELERAELKKKGLL